MYLERINIRIKRRRIDNIDGDTAGEATTRHRFMYCVKTAREATSACVNGLLTNAWELCENGMFLCLTASVCVCIMV